MATISSTRRALTATAITLVVALAWTAYLSAAGALPNDLIVLCSGIVIFAAIIFAVVFQTKTTH